MAQSLSPGVVVGRYEIRSLIGRGGMGEVYEARDRDLDRDVALKILPPELVEQSHRVQRFIQEAKSASALNHPNIVTIYDTGTASVDAQSVYFIAMELLRGRTFRDEIHDKRTALKRLLELLLQVAEGLAKAHRAGIVHRDLKPDNVIVTADGLAKIVDFGLAKLVETRFETTSPTVPKTQEGAILGTIGYMSPEQVEGRPTDQRADVFSFGCILYEALSRRRPFQSDSDVNTLYKIVHDEPQPLPANIDPHLQQITKRCLEKNPEQRYQSMKDLSFDLASVIVPSAAPRPRRRNGAWLAALPVAVAIAIAVAFAPKLIRKSPPPDAGSFVAVLPFTIHGNDNVRYLGDGMADLLSMRLNGVGDVRTVDPHALLAYTAKQKPPFGPDEAAGVASHFGAQMIITGDVLQTAAGLRATASLIDVTGKSVARSEASVENEKDLNKLVDQLAIRLVPEQSGSKDRHLTQLATQTTTSLEALKEYLAGDRELVHANGKAAEHFQRAVDADPSFALAWYRLSVAQEWDGDFGRAFESSAKAVQFAGHLYKRDQDLLKAWNAFMRGDVNAVEALLHMQAGLPGETNEVEHCWLAAETLMHLNLNRGRDPHESRPAFERVLILDPVHAGALAHLIHLSVVDGNKRETAWRCAQYEKLYGDTPDTWCRYNTATDKQKIVDQYIRLRNPWALVPDVTGEHNYPTVERLVQAIIDQAQGRDRVTAFVAAAHYAVGRGKLRASIDYLHNGETTGTGTGALNRAGVLLSAPFLPTPRAELELLKAKLLRVNPHPPDLADYPVLAMRYPYARLYAIGLVSARLEDRAGVEAAAAQMRKLPPLPDVQGTVAKDLIEVLNARLAQMNGDSARALAAIESAPLQYPPNGGEWPAMVMLPRFLRAELLQQNGRLDAALHWYQACTWRSAALFELAYEPVARYRMAEIYERLGRPRDAVREYTMFAEAWKDCDAELRPMLNHARERIAALH